jgi:flagellin
VSLGNDAADAGTIGIEENGVNAAATVVTATDITVTVAGKTAVDIGAVKYGGDITSATAANLKDINHADYGKGIAKSIAERINSIRELREEDQGAGIEGTSLENVYASAKTTFKISDMGANVTTDSAEAAYVKADDYQYVGAGTLKNDGLTINGVNIGPVTTKEKDADGSLTNAINAKSGVTGVTASITDTGELQLTAEDGRDIVISTGDAASANLIFAGGGSGAHGQGTDFGTGFADLRITGKVTVSAMDTITLGGGAATDAGFGTLDETNVQAVGSIANADVSSVETANILIDSVDSALRQVDDMRAMLGATQNRFESTISNLQNVSENLAASRSRIMDADFAAETANLTKTQIMQQAGTAMLAQANQLPQAALALLQ